MNGSKKLAFGAVVLALTVGAGLAVSSASAEPREAARAAVTTSAWAKVNANGQVLGSSGVSAVRKFGIGRYNIDTYADLSNCALLGTINTNDVNDPGPGSSSILVGKVGAHTLYIRTATPSAGGTAAVDSDRPFSVTIICGA
ncbi:hypothetical protein [Streptomyces sp. AP-93]|uniref:hypothetical protein n=1 Tax=Streptomyces sp. AP-93 TaxID=2929048 RepID=UPI001FAFA246|nr:hypothetical protein [Streptomyces sp. AP-93]MCJ0870478.1 hypothetical protein [Streptomyces sp. AP-93]